MDDTSLNQTTPQQAATQAQSAASTPSPADAQPTYTMPTSDNQAGTPDANPISGQTQTPNQPQSSSQQQAPVGGQTQTQQQAPKQPTAASVPQTAQTLQNHPAVQKASVFHAIAQTLAGGPRYKVTIDPQTGTTTRTPVPLSNSQIGMALAVAALTGAASGLGEKGPGAEGRAAQAGFQNAVAQRQQQEAEQQREASQDYARQAAITTTNFNQHLNAVRLGQLDYEDHKQFLTDSAGALANVKDVGAALESNVRESDLLSKYNVTKDMAIPDGIVPRLDPATGKQAVDKYGAPMWDNTYTVIDPNKKIALDQPTADFLAQHHVPGTYKIVDGKTVPIDFTGSPAVRAGIVVDMVAKASGIRITEAQLNQQLSRLPGGATADKVFEANLTQGLQDQTVSPKALQAFAPFASMPFDQALDAMRKSKADQASGGQMSAQIASLIPPDAQEALKKNRLDTEAADKSKREAQAAADKQAAELPGEINKVKQEAAIRARYAGIDAANAETGRLNAKDAFDKTHGGAIGEMLKNPDLDKIPNTGTPPPGTKVNTDFLNAVGKVDPNLQAVIKAVGEGRQAQSKYGLAKQDGQRLAALVNRAYPSYDYTKAESYEKLRNSFTAGDDKNQIEAGNTTMLHAARYLQNAGINATIPESKAKTTLQQDAQQLIEEVNSAYTKGVLHEEKRQELSDGLTSGLPYKRRAAVTEIMNLLGDKIEQKQRTWQRGKPSDAVQDFAIVSPEAGDAFKQVTGKPIYNPPPGSFAGRDGKGNIVQWKTPNGVVDALTGSPVQ